MDIEYFKRIRNGSVSASLRKSGQIGIYTSAMTKYGLEKGRRVLLGYDKEKGIVVIKPLQKDEYGSHVIKRTLDSSGFINALSFMMHFGILPAKSKSFPLAMAADKTLFFAINE